MEQSYQKFVLTLKNFVSDLNRYTSDEGCQEFLEFFDKLDMNKVILRYVGMMSEYETKLKDNDESIFSQQLLVFPGIDLNKLWPKLSSERKKKVFTYLQMLLVLSDMIINSKDKSQQTEVLKTPETTENTVENTSENTSEDAFVKTLDFNPYVGVGGENNLTQYSIDEMFSGPDKLPGDKPQKASLGLGSFSNILGIDKMLNIEELTGQLKNMSKEDIDKATNNLKSLLGPNVNDKTSTLISSMITNIRDELDNPDFKSGNPLDSIMKIAETVASKMKPQMDDDSLDFSNILESTQNIANQCKDENGNPMFQEGMNPFSLISKMMGSKSQQNNQQETNEEDCVNNCNDILKNMGMGGIDLSNIDFSNINLSNLKGLQNND